MGWGRKLQPGGRLRLAPREPRVSPFARLRPEIFCKSQLNNERT